MDRLQMISDGALYEEVCRLERDVRNFEARARRQKAALERDGRCATEDLLYQRFVSLREYLSAQLQQARADALRATRGTRPHPQGGKRYAPT